MLICTFDEYEIHLLDPTHHESLSLLEPGDLSFSQGEWTSAVNREKDFIKEKLIDFAHGKGFYAGIWFKETMIGFIALHDISKNSKSASISYAMGAAFRGKGIMTKACSAIIDYGFNVMDLNRISIGADIQNIPSRKIPEKLGFIKEGILRDLYKSKDGFRDAVQYSMLKREWKS